MNRLGFKNTLVAVVSALMLISLSTTIMVSNQILKKTTAEDLEPSMLVSATYESLGIARHVERSAETAQALALSYPKYVDEVATEKLMALSAKVANVHKVTAGFADGRAFSSKSDDIFIQGIADINKYDPRTRPWFKLGRKSTALTLSDVFFTVKHKVPMLGAVHPIKDGVLLVDIRLNHLKGLLENMNVVEGTVGVITDGKGMILASTADFATVRENIKSLALTSSMASNILNNDHTFNIMDIDGNENAFLSKRVNLVANENWYLIIAVKTELAYTQVNEAAWQLNILALVIAIISALVLLFVLNHLYRPVLELKNTVQKLADGEGDLTSRLVVDSDDDLGDIAKGINAFIENLQSMMLEVRNMTNKLSNGVNVLKTQGSDSAHILKEHYSETAQVVTAMGELNGSAKLVSDHAEETVTFINEANTIADQSKNTIERAQQSLQTLVNEVDSATENVTTMSKETQGIASILSVIGGIADQTNLLALNAAIEAARAGEQGRGFAVVADEVRALAGKTQDSTSEVENALDKLNTGANAVVTAIERTAGTSQSAVAEAEGVATNLGDLTRYVTQINDISIKISTSAHDQSKVIQEIDRAMTSIHHMVESLNRQGQNVRTETDSIEEINQQLVSIVDRFKLN
nr:methyl-accepting chemotaxis protein PctC [uncultured bacterium]